MSTGLCGEVDSVVCRRNIWHVALEVNARGAGGQLQPFPSLLRSPLSQASSAKPSQQWIGRDCIQVLHVPHSAHASSSSSQSNTGIRCLKYIPPQQFHSPKSNAARSIEPGTPPSYPCGLLASGDQTGNIFLHDLATSKVLAKLDAHDREARCLDFHCTPPNNNTSSHPSSSNASNSNSIHPRNLPLLVSGSKDCVVHLHNIFDPSKPGTFTPELVHSNTVTSVRTLTVPRPVHEGESGSKDDPEENLVFVSCGMDKHVFVRRIRPDPPNALLSLRSIELGVVLEDDARSDNDSAAGGQNDSTLRFPNSCVVDAVVHPTRRFLALRCTNQDKKKSNSSTGTRTATLPVSAIVRLIDLTTLREIRAYSLQTRGGGGGREKSVGCEPLRMSLDPSGLILALSLSDKSVVLLDWVQWRYLVQLQPLNPSHASDQFNFDHGCDSHDIVYKFANGLM